jgi:hypothetical protein
MQESPGDLGQKGQQTRQLMAHKRKRQISKATLEFYYRKREQSPGLERGHLWGSSRTE